MSSEASPIAASVPVPAQANSWPKQFWLLLRLQYADYREYAAQMVLFGLLMPIGFQLLMRDGLLNSSQDASWFLGGNAMVSLAFGSASFVLFRMGTLRLVGQLDYYATLPISKSAFVASLFCLSQLSAFPGLMSSFLIGHWWLGIPLGAIWTALPIALVSAVALTVVGAAVGSTAQHAGQLNLLSNALYFVTVFLAPVVVPIERMLLPLRVAAYLLPTGQAALALTDALTATYGQRFWLMMAGLLAWLLVALTVGLRQLDWRRE